MTHKDKGQITWICPYLCGNFYLTGQRTVKAFLLNLYIRKQVIEIMSEECIKFLLQL